jgi:hypothetical protein
VDWKLTIISVLGGLAVAGVAALAFKILPLLLAGLH